MTTTPESFRLRIKAERVNLHSAQIRLIEDMYQRGDITKQDKGKMREILSEEWH